MAAERKYRVYRVFDVDDRLIYVGRSRSVDSRLSGHKHSAWWWPQVARVEVSEPMTYGAAFRAESDAIRGERPRWNIVGRGADLIADASQSNHFAARRAP